MSRTKRRIAQIMSKKKLTHYTWRDMLEIVILFPVFALIFTTSLAIFLAKLLGLRHPVHSTHHGQQQQCQISTASKGQAKVPTQIQKPTQG